MKVKDRLRKIDGKSADLPIWRRVSQSRCKLSLGPQKRIKSAMNVYSTWRVNTCDFKIFAFPNVHVQYPMFSDWGQTGHVPYDAMPSWLTLPLQTHTHVHTHWHTHTHTRTRAGTHTRTHTRTHVTHAHRGGGAHARTHARTHTHTHTHTHRGVATGGGGGGASTCPPPQQILGAPPGAPHPPTKKSCIHIF